MIRTIYTRIVFGSSGGRRRQNGKSLWLLWCLFSPRNWIRARGIHIRDTCTTRIKRRRTVEKKKCHYFSNRMGSSRGFSPQIPRERYVHIYTYCECVDGVGVWITMTVFRVGYNIHIYIYKCIVLLCGEETSRTKRGKTRGERTTSMYELRIANCPWRTVFWRAGYGVRARADYGSCRLVCFTRHRRHTC